MLGLVQGGPFDKQCPNYMQHHAAGDGSSGDRHVLTQQGLAQRIHDQLYDTPEVNCRCDVACRGSVGVPFKLTSAAPGV